VILDTNALSAFADDVPGVVEQVETAEELYVPTIVLGEYRFGIATSRRRRDYEAWLARGRAFWNILAVVEDTTIHYAAIRQELRKAGTPLPANDVWIAAIARQHDLPILTRDDHFDAVAGVTRVSW
jgi:predicted nucleic acid-binding protein